MNMPRRFVYLAILVGAVCVYFIVRLLFFIDLSSRTVQSDVVQGVLIGGGMAFVMAQIFVLIAGAIHIYIFLMESILWGKPKTNKVFGVSQEQADQEPPHSSNKVSPEELEDAQEENEDSKG